MKTNAGYVVPTIHDNGSGRERLIDGYDTAWHSIQTSYQRLKQTAPNSRDYGSMAEFDKATEQHMSRLERLENIQRELACILTGIN